MVLHNNREHRNKDGNIYVITDFCVDIVFFVVIQLKIIPIDVKFAPSSNISRCGTVFKTFWQFLSYLKYWNFRVSDISIWVIRVLKLFGFSKMLVNSTRGILYSLNLCENRVIVGHFSTRQTEHRLESFFVRDNLSLSTNINLFSSTPYFPDFSNILELLFSNYYSRTAAR